MSVEFESRYVSHPVDENGMVNYSSEENTTWQLLFERQMKLIPGRACEEYIEGLDKIGLRPDAIPQLPEVSRSLSQLTGWEVAPVAALISARDFFELLANRRFPAATFIRVREELNYIQEPDIFHELFGHCPLLTDPVYADFVQAYAQKVLKHPESDWPLLQRLFWFTVEFGLIKTDSGLRAYGGGILSSIKETEYSVESDLPLRVLFNPIAAFRTPYRIDRLQDVYFVIESYQQLYDFLSIDTHSLIESARALGEFPPVFPVEENNPSIHINMLSATA